MKYTQKDNNFVKFFNVTLIELQCIKHHV